MRNRPFLTTLSAVALSGVAGLAAAQTPDPILMNLKGLDGEDMGSIAVRPAASGGVLLDLNLTGFDPGSLHGFHIHETGECDASGGFQSAGGHFAPASKDHGFFVETGHHAGDMPNIQVTELGDVRTQIFNDAVTLDDTSPNGIVGKAIIVHSTFDDYMTQPAGAAGDRIACGIIGE